jgi:hypothetical protein
MPAPAPSSDPAPTDRVAVVASAVSGSVLVAVRLLVTAPASSDTFPAAAAPPVGDEGEGVPGASPTTLKAPPAPTTKVVPTAANPTATTRGGLRVDDALA